MNLYDRDYYRDEDEEQGWGAGSAQEWIAQMGVVHYLIAINVVLWLVGLFTPLTSWDVVTVDGRHVPVPYSAEIDNERKAIDAVPDGARAYPGSRVLSTFFALRTDFWKSEPWGFWRLLTHGFVHAPWLMHVLMNMYGLYLFGRGCEEKLGRREFLAMYLAAILCAGLVSVSYYAVGNALDPALGYPITLGASGAVYTLIVLYALYFPFHKFQFLLLPGVQIPAWGLAVGYVGIDLISSFISTEPVAYEAHLGGAAFGALYFLSRASFTGWLPEGPGAIGKWFATKPDLKLHDPDEDEDTYPEPEEFDDEPPPMNWDAEGDRLLAKVHREGIESLSSSERAFLEEYSRRLRNRRR